MDFRLWIEAVWTSVWAGAFATGAAALPCLVLRSTSDRARTVLSGFAAGVMLAATFFSLLAPGMDLALERWGRPTGVGISAAGFVVGTAAIALGHRLLPHLHFEKAGEAPPRASIGRMWLFVLAFTIHNWPEGMAVGVAVGSGEASIAMPVALGIAAQNAPEGLVVALALLREGYSPWKAIGVAFLSGAVEPLGAALGAGALAISSALLPFALCFAAGAMLFVISDEVLPETHRGPHAGAATWGVVAGFVLMMVLDTVFGG